MQNYMEDLVQQALMNEARNNAKNYVGICGCGHCMAYVMCKALNSLRPWYVDDDGKVYGDAQNKGMNSAREVADAVRASLEHIVSNPQHV